jgi:hypothetical protein
VTARPRVLAFADVRTSLVAAARVHAPLRALQAAGLVGDVVVADAGLRGVPRRAEFDVVWLQRGADARLAKLLAQRLPGGYLLDLDDHLLCRPAYLSPAELPDRLALTAALDACAVLTTPTERLRRLLERRTGLTFRRRAHVCANAVPFGAAPARGLERPRAVLLAQGHRLALHDSRREVLAAIADGAARHGLPVWALGALPDGLTAAARRAGATLEHLRPRSWEAYHQALAGPPALLGVAPLETAGDADTLEFVAGKSDVKMVEFAGFGHPAVYSDAPPYRDSGLRCGRLAANTYAAWTEAIDDLLDDGWREAPAEAHVVREHRDLRRIAVEHWWPAVEAARLEEPVDVRRLVTPADRAAARARERAARVRWRLDRGVG